MAKDNDVVVFYQNRYYLVTENQWKTTQNEAAAGAVDQKAAAAIQNGALVAFFPDPQTPGPGAGAYSTVINLEKITKV